MGKKSENMDRRESDQDGLSEDVSRYAKASRKIHDAVERSKAMDGREEEVRRRQERADKDNEARQ